MIEALYFLVGLMASFLGSMAGLGGGFLAVPTLYYLGLPISNAVATSKFMVFINSLTSTYRYSRRLKNPVKLYLAVVTPMTVTAYLGAYLAATTPKKILALIVGLVLLAGSTRMLLEKGEKRGEKKLVDERRVYVLGAFLGTISGIISGLTGLGGGVVNVPAFIYVLNLPVHNSASLSMACILPAAISSTIRHAIDRLIVWKAAIPISLGAVVGGWLGPKTALKLSKEKLRKIIGAILFAAVLRMILQAIFE